MKEPELFKEQIDVHLPSTVLIVEDDGPLLHLIGRTLKKAGYAIDSKETGSDALTYLMTAKDGDIIMLLDYQLPDMNGKELLRRLREFGRNVPFIVMTGYGDVTEAVEMMKMGALDYFEKNRNFLDLMPAVLQKAIRQLKTERELNESRRRLSQALKEAMMADEAKGQFLANMSHEIRTPLHHVIGLSDILMDSDISEKQMEMIRMIHSSAGTLQAMIEDVFDMAMIDSHKLALNSSAFSLRQTLDPVLHVFSLRAGNKGLGFKVSIMPEVPDQLVGDPVRLKQIMRNLLDNAVKFTDIGEVNIAVKKEEEKENVAGLRFTIADTGIGIPADYHEKIFKAFTRIESSYHHRYGGSGMGLTIAYCLVMLMGGQMDVTSRPGEGSEFSLLVPFGIGGKAGGREGELSHKTARSIGFS